MTTTREQAISFLKSSAPINMRASNAPQQFRALVRAIHAAYWDEDGNVVNTPEHAIASGLNATFPAAQALKIRKGSEGCARCGGTGYIAAFAHVHGGRCVAC